MSRVRQGILPGQATAAEISEEEDEEEEPRVRIGRYGAGSDENHRAQSARGSSS